jgi:tetratricopeptide (TPR) repeat protein
MKGSDWWRRHAPDLTIGAGLVGAVLVAFSGVFGNGFVNFDDPLYITANPFTQQGLSAATVVWAFTTNHGANWHPLTWLSLMLDVDLFGLDPLGHHAMSLGLHGLNTVLVFIFMRRLGIGRGSSAFATGLFGLHPLHVESVAWAAERKDVLSMAFGLLTLLGYLRYAEVPSRGRMALITGLFVLGLMAKPMLVTVPFVFLLLDWWPLRRVGSPAWLASPEVAPGGQTPPVVPERFGIRRLVLEKAPLFGVALLSCIITYLAQKTYGRPLERLPLVARVENAAHAYVEYLRNFVFPTKLACFYPMMDLGKDRVALSIGMLALLTLVAWRLRTTRPYAFVGWLWFLGSLVPMIGIVQVGGQAYADRYTYFPSLGLGFAASLGLGDAVGHARLPRSAVILSLCSLLAVLGVATRRQTLVWRESVGLFEHTLAVTGHNWFVRRLLAAAFIENEEFARAEILLQESLSDGAPPATIHVALSALYDREHREDDAVREIDRALVIEPDNWRMLVNRGFYLTKLRRDAEAVAVLERAIALDTGNDPMQLDVAHRTLAAAQRRLAREERPEAGPAAPR